MNISRSSVGAGAIEKVLLNLCFVRLPVFNGHTFKHKLCLPVYLQVKSHMPFTAVFPHTFKWPYRHPLLYYLGILYSAYGVFVCLFVFLCCFVVFFCRRICNNSSELWPLVLSLRPLSHMY